MLHEVKTGWHWLERTLNEVIRAVNQQKPLPSASIAIEESPNGTLLKVVGQGQDQGATGGGGGGSGPVVWNDVGWMTVTIVDPRTCTPSQIQVLVFQPGGSVQIQ
jgi:hypothetical protein